MDPRLRRLPAILLLLAALALGSRALAPRPAPGAGAGPPDTVEISAAERAATLRFAPEVAEGDRAWVMAAIAASRPEARRLIDEVDGLVEVRTHAGDPLGVTRTEWRGAGASFVIDLDIAALNGIRTVDRDVVVLHELGHAIDHAIVGADTGAGLDAGIPRTGTCVRQAAALTGSCTQPEERFADTFAKWALRGGVSALGAGYGVATPPSLEAWGAPLTVLGGQLGNG